MQDTGEWFTYLGIIGLAVYAAMAVKRPAWAPSDLTLNIVSMAACALGGLLLAHPGDRPREGTGIMQDATVTVSLHMPVFFSFVQGAPAFLPASCMLVPSLCGA